MKYDLTSFFDGDEYAYKLEGEIYEVPALDSGHIIDPIKYNGKIYKVDGSSELHVDIQYKYEDECSRCLKPTTRVYNTVLSGKLMTNKGKYNDEDESEEIIFYEDGHLNLEEYIWSHVVSSLPMKTLCSNDCKGLCPNCGIDLNYQSCNCMGNTIDPRLEKLKELFPKK
ncbi:DUF177 domain-containing protein [Tissierella creatinini]|nr:DUF177 domain-containing protein [Tissierella creatinini]TJX69183.1 DUF177 domain-containing protein [Soehngenia saccharolytica]